MSFEDVTKFFADNWLYFVIGLAVLIVLIIVIIVCAKKSHKKTKAQKNIKKESTQTTETETKSTQRSQKYMVTYDKTSHEWLVKKTTNMRVTRRCKTKEEALKIAQKLSKTTNLNLTVQKRNGQFQKQ